MQTCSSLDFQVDTVFLKHGCFFLSLSLYSQLYSQLVLWGKNGGSSQSLNVQSYQPRSLVRTNGALIMTFGGFVAR